MTNEEHILQDPLGNKIILHPGILTSNEEKNPADILTELSSVIQKPAILIETSPNQVRELYYFRSISWDYNLLVKTRIVNHIWKAVECVVNPTTEQLSSLFLNGRQLI
jgi:hypothetical protein